LIFANPTTCPLLVDGNNTYYGIAIGDVDGSWAGVVADGIRKSASSDAVIFDLANAYRIGDYLDIPLMVSSSSTVNSLDFVVEYNNESASFEKVSNRTDYINALDKNDGQYYALTSYSLSGYEVEKPIMFVHVYAPKGFEAKDVLNATAYVNGNKSTTVLESSIKVDVSATVRIYPNPVSEILSVEVPQEVTLQLYNALGKTMFIKTNVAGKEEIDVRGLASGFYTMKISNSNFTSFKQIVVTK
jgi:hypothetical protein